MIDQRESSSQGLTRLKNICNSLEEALSHARGIEGDYQRGLLEAHIRGALREMNAQRAELVSSLSTMQRDGHTARAFRSPQYVAPNTINVADGSGGDFVDCGGNPIGGDGVMDTATKDAENPVQADFREDLF